jgi:hypothetical protein
VLRPRGACSSSRSDDCAQKRLTQRICRRAGPRSVRKPSQLRKVSRLASQPPLTPHVG